MFRFARRFAAPAAVVLTPISVYCADRKLDQRLRTDNTVPLGVSQKQLSTLGLIATGMRRKSFYIVEVDVYVCGLNLTKAAESKVKSLKGADANSKAAVEVLLGSPSASPYPECNVSITLQFVRAVTKQQCVDAFVDAFKGCSAEGIAKFSELLGDAVGTDGCKVGEEINFYWVEGGGLFIDKAGVKQYSLRDTEIERRLLEVYLDPSKTVSAELVKSFNEYLSS